MNVGKALIVGGLTSANPPTDGRYARASRFIHLPRYTFLLALTPLNYEGKKSSPPRSVLSRGDVVASGYRVVRRAR